MKPLSLILTAAIVFSTSSAHASQYGLAKIVPEYNWSSCNLKGRVKSINVKFFSYYHDAGTPPLAEGKESGGAKEEYLPSGKLISDRCDNGQVSHSFGNWLINLDQEYKNTTNFIYKRIPGGNTRRVVRANNGYSEYDFRGWIVDAAEPEITNCEKIGGCIQISHDIWEYHKSAIGLSSEKYAVTNNRKTLVAKFLLSNDGLLEKEFLNYPDGSPMFELQYEYVFDKQGNWIERKSYNISTDAQGNKLKENDGKTIRKIEYY
jgi:hypothetical protein